MYCPQCGAETETDAKWCSECGRALDDSPGESPPERIPNYLPQAILVTVLCCLPFGIPAIVFAARVNSQATGGSYELARESSQKAKMWCWVAFGSGLAFLVLYFLVIIIGIAAEY